jgi:hypothetical protein
MTRREIERMAKDVVRAGWAQIEGAETFDDMEGNKVQSVFLGTVFALMPSGKFYLPFACSNVAPCPRCKGTGKHSKYPQSCDFCQGTGTREGIEDELMNEALDFEADKFGCFVHGGEGDPCDIFLSRVVENETPEFREAARL